MIIQVRAKVNRYGFDGETGCLVLRGTTGTIETTMYTDWQEDEIDPAEVEYVTFIP